MKDMHTLLDEAEDKWRAHVKEDFPLRGDTEVVKSSKQDGRDWTFSTDLQKTFANIANDEALRKKFEKLIVKYWDGKPEELARETLKYLLDHELYHPLEAPRSVSGDDNDNKKIHQSIRRGVLQAEPGLSPLEQFVKVSASQNGVKDFILDNRLSLDNADKKHFRADIIPVWDVLELEKAEPKTSFYTVTRLLYGLFYGPESTHPFFEDKSGDNGHKVAEEAMGSLLRRTIKLPGKLSLVDKAKKVLGVSSGEEDPKQYVKPIREVFAGNDRYTGIQRLMKVLGPYIEKGMPQGRSDIGGEGAGSSPHNILQDLLDDMNPEEQQQFVQGLMQEGQVTLEQLANSQPMTKKPQGASSTSSSSDEMKNLDLLATHEFYKRNHPKVKIVGGRKLGESLVVGQREYWDLKSSRVITEDDLKKINLTRLNELQKRTRLPWLIDLGNGTFRLNEYQIQEKNIKDIVYVEKNIDIPDVVEFYLDSSGSMFNGTAGKFKVNDGNRWDMLSHVFYGFVDALNQAGKHVGKQGKMRIHNFANSQVDSEIVPVSQFWNGDLSALNVLFKPNNGYSHEDINIGNFGGQKRAYVIVTDGDLVLSGRTERESAKMKNLARNPDNHVVLFEMGGTYGLGEAVRNDPNVRYYQVHNKDEMLKAGLEVLLSK